MVGDHRFGASYVGDLTSLSRRERDVLALMAQGRSNAGIAKRLWITQGTVEKHVTKIMNKLGLADSSDDHRRVRAVVIFLEQTAQHTIPA
ncbi:hypothetical protein BCA37_11860 [Mycobacterium sp. djl-10]|nr:hypothetical protein BCA37_11860 [Mycobacterium sp. djl-10]